MTASAPLDPATMEVLNVLEATRIALRKKMMIHIVICCAGAMIAVLGFMSTLIPIGIIGIICLITGFVLMSISSTAVDQYRLDFKQKVIAQALHTIDDSLEIDPKRGLAENEFIKSLLFNRRPDKYRSEDLVEGNGGKTKLSFSEVQAHYKEVTNTKRGRQETWHEIFSGVIFQADFNKHLKGTTVVQSRVFGSGISDWFMNNVQLFSGDDSRVKLESPEFEKTFITHSSDQIEARYILTPLMMESISTLNDRCKYSISLSFIGNMVTIAFPQSKNYFEAPLFKSLMTDGLLKEDLELVRHIYQVIETLNLNTRIWGKD
ncbi:DUF3137 domain-containing protein [Pedobacter sp. N36a]|uniref:DUF3137 domain-containing protein n=1 Tax=Pedobacter sp. N36a TaxID=2767996 RepID=UPI0016570B3B|nr:DUF3137 domain-containing protein [Pedobacter sp. N36a]MBC8985417.1 DUF3137 domain-containing protein [Pedobacter sp. N36a]